MNEEERLLEGDEMFQEVYIMLHSPLFPLFLYFFTIKIILKSLWLQKNFVLL